MADNVYYVTAAYAATWIVLIAYVAWLRAANRRARAAYDHASSAGAQR